MTSGEGRVQSVERAPRGLAERDHWSDSKGPRVVGEDTVEEQSDRALEVLACVQGR